MTLNFFPIKENYPISENGAGLFSFNNIHGKHCPDEHTYIIENGITIKADYWNDSRFQPEVCRLASVTFRIFVRMKFIKRQLQVLLMALQFYRLDFLLLQ